jgi:hypothetical protein
MRGTLDETNAGGGGGTTAPAPMPALAGTVLPVLAGTVLPALAGTMLGLLNPAASKASLMVNECRCDFRTLQLSWISNFRVQLDGFRGGH